MRLWSLHPKYLDRKGLLAVWREGLLARKVLLGKTRGYKNHPQLIRFKQSKNSVSSINSYLFGIYQEALLRGYKFSPTKIGKNFSSDKISITTGQLNYEFKYLLKKLKQRDYRKYLENKQNKKIEPHPLFRIKQGKIASWEKIK